MTSFHFSNKKYLQDKTKTKFCDRYLELLSIWFGYEVKIMEDFDVLCQCELDFIEILLLGEQEFAGNLLDNSQERKNFPKIKNFLRWAEADLNQQLNKK